MKPAVFTLALMLFGCGGERPSEPAYPSNVGPRLTGCSNCALYSPTQAQLDMIQTALSRISNVGSECAAVRQTAENGIYRVYENTLENSEIADYHYDTMQTHLGDRNFGNETELQKSIIHEAAHANGYGEEMSNWLEEACLNPILPT